MDDFERLKSDYIELKSNELQELSKVQLPPSKSISFNLAKLNDEAETRRLTEFVESIKSLEQVLYYFSLSSIEHNKAILKKVKGIKKRRKTPRLPQLNENNVKSQILYVGKTAKSGFGNRIKQHLGFSNSLKTYALHLTQWATNFDLKVELHFVQPNMNGNRFLLEDVESILHLGLKPLMGRSGH